MKKNTFILGALATAIAVSGLAAPSFAAREKPTREQRAERMIKRLDTNGDKKVSLEEAQASAASSFKTFDANGDGKVTEDEIKAKRDAFRDARKAMRELKDKTGPEKAAAREKVEQARTGMMPGVRPKMFKRADVDKDGSLSATEVSEMAAKMFKRQDRNGDGFVDAADYAKKI